MRVSRVVAMWQTAEVWCLPASTMSRWYLAARVGSSAAGVVGGHEQRLAEHGVAAFGRAAVPAGQAGGVQGGHQTGEGADRRPGR